MIVDFNYYISNYSGEHNEFKGKFDYFSKKAENEIVRRGYKFDAMNDNEIENAKFAICEIINLLFNYASLSTEHIGISSEHVGDYSVSYTDNEKVLKSADSNITSIINTWIKPQNLTYRGVFHGI